MRYKTVLVEDEENALNLLKTLLDDHREDIEIVAVAQDGPEAVRIINDLQPDLVFMDVNLPGKNAFEVLDDLEEQPLLVMITAHPEHALQAFETNAIGYLVKPFDPDDLTKVIQKIRRVSPITGHLLQDVHTILKEYPLGISCKVGNKLILVPNEDVQFLQSELKYTTVASRGRRYLVEAPLIELESRLDPGLFLRIHRSCIVNITQITELKPLDDGRLEVFIKESAETIHASRRYSDRLKSLWI